jgi:hypothetical protein
VKPPTPYFDEGWHREQIAASTGNGRTGEPTRVEVLWSDRPLGQQCALNPELEDTDRAASSSLEERGAVLPAARANTRAGQPSLFSADG